VLYDADGDVRDEDLAAMRWTLLPERREQSKGAHAGPLLLLAQLQSADVRETERRPALRRRGAAPCEQRRSLRQRL
jgi:hypothetical protein